MFGGRTHNVIETPAARDWPFEDVWLEVDGEKTHGWWLPVENARGAVLFSHGSGRNLSGYLEDTAFYRELGFSVLLYDYGGYGQSTGAAVGSSLLRGCACDVGTPHPRAQAAAGAHRAGRGLDGRRRDRGPGGAGLPRCCRPREHVYLDTRCAVGHLPLRPRQPDLPHPVPQHRQGGPASNARCSWSTARTTRWSRLRTGCAFSNASPRPRPLWKFTAGIPAQIRLARGLRGHVEDIPRALAPARSRLLTRAASNADPSPRGIFRHQR